ncbi:MAG: hypothetical protein IJI07_02935 [Flexilinea sp.]|nr:hypothetical protein [Flexilinea sp.]
MLIVILACCIVPVSGEDGSAMFVNNWYEIFVRSFQDSNGDGLGDLPGVIERLDYLEDMGYNGIWLMPVMPSPSYHKYDVTDYLSIDPEYGSLADMQRLVSEVHARGMKIILDLPLNHSSLQHPWFLAAAEAIYSGKDSTFIDYYNFRQSPGDKYVQLGDTGWYYEEQFSGGGMPDLNLDDPDVRAQISIILEFWLNDIGADGFRLDAVTSFFAKNTEQNVAFLRWLKDECERLKPGSYLVGECWEGLSTIAEYYASGVDSFFLFPGSQAEGFIASSLRGRSKRAEKFAQRYQSVLEEIPEGILAPFLSNHDTGRTIGSVQGRQNLPIAKFVEGVMNMMQGNVFTYYGEEIGMVGSGPDPNKRLAMYWNGGDMPEQPPGITAIEYAYPSVDEQLADHDSLLNYCRKVNQARLAYPMIANGNNEFVLVQDDILVMRRTLGEDSCLIAMNFSPKAAGDCPVPADAAIGMDIETGSDQASLSDGTLTLPPYAIVILQ